MRLGLRRVFSILLLASAIINLHTSFALAAPKPQEKEHEKKAEDKEEKKPCAEEKAAYAQIEQEFAQKKLAILTDKDLGPTEKRAGIAKLLREMNADRKAKKEAYEECVKNIHSKKTPKPETEKPTKPGSDKEKPGKPESNPGSSEGDKTKEKPTPEPELGKAPIDVPTPLPEKEFHQPDIEITTEERTKFEFGTDEKPDCSDIRLILVKLQTEKRNAERKLSELKKNAANEKDRKARKEKWKKELKEAIAKLEGLLVGSRVTYDEETAKAAYENMRQLIGDRFNDPTTPDKPSANSKEMDSYLNEFQKLGEEIGEGPASAAQKEKLAELKKKLDKLKEKLNSDINDDELDNLMFNDIARQRAIIEKLAKRIAELFAQYKKECVTATPKAEGESEDEESEDVFCSAANYSSESALEDIMSLNLTNFNKVYRKMKSNAVWSVIAICRSEASNYRLLGQDSSSSTFTELEIEKATAVTKACLRLPRVLSYWNQAKQNRVKKIALRISDILHNHLYAVSDWTTYSCIKPDVSTTPTPVPTGQPTTDVPVVATPTPQPTTIVIIVPTPIVEITPTPTPAAEPTSEVLPPEPPVVSFSPAPAV